MAASARRERSESGSLMHPKREWVALNCCRPKDLAQGQSDTSGNHRANGLFEDAPASRTSASITERTTSSGCASTDSPPRRQRCHDCRMVSGTMPTGVAPRSKNERRALPTRCRSGCWDTCFSSVANCDSCSGTCSDKQHRRRYCAMTFAAAPPQITGMFRGRPRPDGVPQRSRPVPWQVGVRSWRQGPRNVARGSVHQPLGPDLLQDGGGDLFDRLGGGGQPADAGAAHHGFGF